MIDRDGPHLDPVFARIAHQLGGGVEPHRLGVKQRAGEDRLMMALQPGRDIDQPGKAGRMAFGKAVAAEAFDLCKTARREIGVITAHQHARDEAVAERSDGAHALEGGKAAAQTVRLGRGETGGDHGDLHGLFLKQRHAVGAPQHLHQRGAKVFDLLLALTAVDERMHHAALDRAGADDGNLAHQIIELAGLHPGQEIQLRPAFDLKRAHGIGAAEHVVDAGVFGRNIGEGHVLAPEFVQQSKGLADAGQHPQRQNIDLQQAQRVDVVLVPFDDGAVFHRGILDGAKFVQTALGDDKAADMLGQMARKTDDLADQLRGQHHPFVGRVNARLAHPVFARGGRGPAPDLARQARDHVLRQAHRLADLADRGAAAQVDHGGGQPGAVAAIAFIDPLDHLFAPFVFEIDVDIRRLAAFLRDEAFEDQRDGFGRNLGDAQKIADHRIGCRPPPLAQDAFGAGELHDVMHGQEIGRILDLADQRQFLLRAVDDLGRRAIGIAPVQPLTRQAFQTVLRGLAVLGLIGVLVAQIAKAERTRPRDVHAAADRGGIAVKQPRHLGPRFQPMLAIGQAARADGVDGAPLAHAGQNVGQGAAGGAVHQDMAHRDQRQAGHLRQARQPVEPVLIAAVIAGRGAQIALIGESLADAGQVGLRGVAAAFVQGIGRQGNQDHALAPVQQIGTGQVAFTLVRAALAKGQKPGQPGPGGHIGRQRDPFHRTVGQNQPCAGDQLGQGRLGQNRRCGFAREMRHGLAAGVIGHALRADHRSIGGAIACGPDRRLCLVLQPRQFLQRGIGPHHAGDRVAVGDGDGLQPQFGGAGHQLFGVRGPGEEGEVRGDAQFGISCHANSPATCQPGVCGV